MKGNERADKLAGDAVIRGTLVLDTPAVMASVEECLTTTESRVSRTPWEI